MGNKRTVFLLLISIFLLASALIFTLDFVGIVQASEIIPFLEKKPERVIEDKDYPTEVDKEKYKKIQEKLIEKEEQLAQREEKIKKNEELIKKKLAEIKEVSDSLKAKQKKMVEQFQDLNDRKSKIKDLANKIANMPPNKAVEIMNSWRDFDIIEVIRQMDADAKREGTDSITPYLLTLFNKERSAEITRKMLLPPLIREEN